MVYCWRMRIILSSILLAVVAMFSIQLMSVHAEWAKLSKRLAELSETVHAAEEEQESLRADLEYYGNEQNALKAARALGNYRRGGEELMIVIPKRGE